LFFEVEAEGRCRPSVNISANIGAEPGRITARHGRSRRSSNHVTDHLAAASGAPSGGCAQSPSFPPHRHSPPRS